MLIEVPDKVNMVHDGRMITVARNDVHAHLLQGDLIGQAD